MLTKGTCLRIPPPVDEGLGQYCKDDPFWEASRLESENARLGPKKKGTVE